MAARHPTAERVATVGTVCIAVLFFASGLAKWLQLESMVLMFQAFHLPRWLLFAVGALELLTAALLLVRRTRLVGAMGVCAVMAGAFLSHLMFPVYIAMVYLEAACFLFGLWLVMRERPAFLFPDWEHDPHRHSPRPR